MVLLGCAPPFGVRAADRCIAPAGDAPGFDAQALCQALPEIAAGGANLHGVLVEHRGRLRVEAYFDGWDQPGGSLFSRPASFDSASLHDVRSVTKSIVGLLFGIALERGLVDSIETPVLDFFPEHADLRSPERVAIRLKHLLSMTAGLEWDESGSYLRLGNSETRMRFASDPMRFVLERPVVAPPGERFEYCGGATALLGEVLARRSGKPLERFAEEALFEPMAIGRYEWRRQDGKVTPFGGLRLVPHDLVRLGRLLLDGGTVDGRQVVPAEWIKESFVPRITASAGRRYGYQWWIGRSEAGGRQHDWVAALGNGGQRLFLVPALDLVVVITAGQYNQNNQGLAPTQVFRRALALAYGSPSQ